MGSSRNPWTRMVLGLTVVLGMVSMRLEVDMVQGAVLEGSLDDFASWEFLDRFAFRDVRVNNGKVDGEQGQIEFEVDFPNGTLPEVAIFDMSFERWRRILAKGLHCSQLVENKATGNISLTLPAFVDPKQSSDERIFSSGTLKYGDPKGDWAFIVLHSCRPSCDALERNCQAPLTDINYYFHLTNGGTLYQREFSREDFGALELCIFFLCLQALLCCCAVPVCNVLQRRRKFHHTVRLLVWSMALLLGSIISFTVHYGIFANNGKGSAVLLFLGYLLFSIADVLFILLLVLIASGWTIVVRKLSSTARVVIACYTTTLTIMTVLAQIWIVFGLDPSADQHLYTSSPGVVIVALRVTILGWFMSTATNTLTTYDKKRHFYWKFTVCFGSWIITFPLLLVIALEAASPVDFKIVVWSFQILFLFVGHAILLAMYNPNTAFNKSFPFHANTSAMLGITRPRANDATAGSAGPTDSSAGPSTGGTGPPSISTPASGLARSTSMTGASLRAVFTPIQVTGERALDALHQASTLRDELSELLRDWRGEFEGDEELMSPNDRDARDEPMPEDRDTYGRGRE